MQPRCLLCNQRMDEHRSSGAAVKWNAARQEKGTNDSHHMGDCYMHLAKGKKPDLKSYIMYGSILITFREKRQANQISLVARDRG